MKLVREYINFERRRDIKKTLDIGLFNNPELLVGKVFRAKVWSGVNSWGKITNSSTYDYINEGDYIYIVDYDGLSDENLYTFKCFKFDNFQKLKNCDLKNLHTPNYDWNVCRYEHYSMTMGTFRRRFEYVPEELYESLEFERGKDPKETMKIGSARGGEALFNLIFEEAKKSPRVFVYPQKPTIVGRLDHYAFRKLPEKKEKYFKIVLREHVSIWARKEVFVILTEAGDVWYYDTEFEEYHPIKNLKDFYKYFNKTELTESLDFERGKDPKTSIGVGIESQMEKKFKLWKVFKRCNDLSHISENFEWVSEIQFDDPNPYFNIRSYFYYTDEEDNKYPLNYVIRLFDDYIYCKEVIAENEEEVRTVKGFVEFTEAFEEDEQWRGVFESLDFERENNPYKSLRVGKYRPEKFKFKDYEGDIVEIEVINNSFKLNDLDVRLEFDEDEDGEETADVYVDGQKSDMAVFKMIPFDYEFKSQGEYAEPGYTGYGYPIAKNKKDLERLKDKHSYWHVGSGDYTREDKNPFVAVAKMILFTY